MLASAVQPVLPGVRLIFDQHAIAGEECHSVNFAQAAHRKVDVAVCGGRDCTGRHVGLHGRRRHKRQPGLFESRVGGVGEGPRTLLGAFADGDHEAGEQQLGRIRVGGPRPRKGIYDVDPILS